MNLIPPQRDKVHETKPLNKIQPCTIYYDFCNKNSYTLFTIFHPAFMSVSSQKRLIFIGLLFSFPLRSYPGLLKNWKEQTFG